MMRATGAVRCWAEIDLAALRHNAVVAQERVGPKAALLAVIKANGYGHGLPAVAEALSASAEIFGVANLDEALAARAVVPNAILILGPALPVERTEIARAGFIASVSNYDEALGFAGVARQAPVPLNLAIDTGMGRMGVRNVDAMTTLKKIAGIPNVQIHSISTHLPSADDDAEFTQRQLREFSASVTQIRSAVPGSYRVHVLPSAGVLGFAAHAYEIVRAGLILYGISPLPEFQNLLRPAMTLKSRIVLLRDLPIGASVSYGRTFTARKPMRTATLAIGYADGYPRALSNRGAAVLIHGVRCPVLGRVTMDLTIVDVTEVPHATVGDEAVLFGQQGEHEILASEVAQRASTITWDVFTGIGSRVERVYH